MKFDIKRRAPIMGMTMAGAALALGAVAGPASASPVNVSPAASPVGASAGAPVVRVASPVGMAGANAPGISEKQEGTGARRPLPVNYVKVSEALLRAQPNRHSTKLDVSQRGRGVTLYCWHDYTDVSHYIWYRTHPWGSKYTGWMRADLIHRGSKLPPKC